MSKASARAVLSSILRSRLNQKIAIGALSLDKVDKYSLLIIGTIELIGKYYFDFWYQALKRNDLEYWINQLFLS